MNALEIQWIKGVLHLNGRPAQFWIDECERLKDAVRSARADEANCWSSRVDMLTTQLRTTDKRYMDLLKAVADGRALQPAPPIFVRLEPNAANNPEDSGAAVGRSG